MSIRPDYTNLTSGWSDTADPYACLAEWEKRGHVRDAENAVWHARIITYMAGAEAEVSILGSTHGGDSDDRYQIEMMAESHLELNADSWALREARLRAMTRMLIRRHRERIERLADALLKKRALTREQADKLTGRSIEDARCNAPFLLEMHRLRSNGQSS